MSLFVPAEAVVDETRRLGIVSFRASGAVVLWLAELAGWAGPGLSSRPGEREARRGEQRRGVVVAPASSDWRVQRWARCAEQSNGSRPVSVGQCAVLSYAMYAAGAVVRCGAVLRTVICVVCPERSGAEVELRVRGVRAGVRTVELSAPLLQTNPASWLVSEVKVKFQEHPGFFRPSTCSRISVMVQRVLGVL